MLKILKSVREYKKESFLAPLFMALEVLMEVLIPLLMSRIIDVGIKNSDIRYVLKMGLILILISIFALLSGILSGIFASRASAGFSKNLRKDIFYNIQNFSFKNIDKFSTASLVTRMSSDITNIQMSYMLIIRLLARTLIMIILSLVMTFKINSKIAILFLYLIPILSIALASIVKIAFPLFIKAFKEYDNLNKKVQENVNASRVVKAYVRDDFENEKFKDSSTKVFNLFNKAERLVSFNSLIMPIAGYLVIIMILLISSKSIVNQSMPIGQLTTVIIYSMQILMAIMMLTFIFVMFMIAQASIKRVVEVLDEKTDIFNVANPIKEIKNGDISFEKVSFSYAGKNSKLVLKNISFEIKQGQTIGIIGETGSAKSTLIQLIPRLYDVTHGVVKVGGINVKNYDIKALRDSISIVLQKNILFSGTIAENIRWGNPDASLEEIIYASKLARAYDFINELENKYDSEVLQGGNNFSGGQKQRIAIARALLKKPKILILDDSTSAVDMKTDEFIRKSFKEELLDTTKIIIAQRISSIEDADFIIVMNEGRINGIGTSKELLETNEIYKDIYNSQVEKGGNFDEE